MPPRPLVVIEAPQQAVTPVLALLEAVGWTISRGFQLPTDEWSVGGIVCVGTVTSASDAALATLAGVRGAGLVVAVSARNSKI